MRGLNCMTYKLRMTGCRAPFPGEKVVLGMEGKRGAKWENSAVLSRECSGVAILTRWLLALSYRIWYVKVCNWLPRLITTLTSDKEGSDLSCR